MQRLIRTLKPTLVATAGVVTALGVASLTQAAPGGGYAASTTPTTTSTTPTATTTTSTTTTPTKTTTAKTTTTKTTTTPAKKPAVPQPKATTRTITCTATLIATMTPIDNAENFGKTKCSAPLGKGVQYDYSKITRTSKTAGSLAGSFKLFFNTGTLRGRFDMTFAAGSGKATYEGTMKVSSGTGEFAGVKGEGPINGTSDDLVHTAVTEKLTLTIPPAKMK